MAQGKKESNKPGVNPNHYPCGTRRGDWIVSMLQGRTKKQWIHRPA
jgi:hypothetical protein